MQLCIVVDDLAEHRPGENRFAVQCVDHDARRVVMFAVAASGGVVDGQLAANEQISTGQMGTLANGHLGVN